MKHNEITQIENILGEIFMQSINRLETAVINKNSKKIENEIKQIKEIDQLKEHIQNIKKAIKTIQT